MEVIFCEGGRPVATCCPCLSLAALEEIAYADFFQWLRKSTTMRSFLKLVVSITGSGSFGLGWLASPPTPLLATCWSAPEDPDSLWSPFATPGKGNILPIWLSKVDLRLLTDTPQSWISFSTLCIRALLWLLFSRRWLKADTIPMCGILQALQVSPCAAGIVGSCWSNSWPPNAPLTPCKPFVSSMVLSTAFFPPFKSAVCVRLATSRDMLLTISDIRLHHAGSMSCIFPSVSICWRASLFRVMLTMGSGKINLSSSVSLVSSSSKAWQRFCRETVSTCCCRYTRSFSVRSSPNGPKTALWVWEYFQPSTEAMVSVMSWRREEQEMISKTFEMYHLHLDTEHTSWRWRRLYLSVLVQVILQPDLQLSHHHLALPLSYGLASLVVSGHQGVYVCEDHVDDRHLL